MASWKKVIVSGSSAELLNITASNAILVGTNQQITTLPSTTFLSGSFSGSFTGPLTGTITGTASYASQALSSSYANTASVVNSIANNVSNNVNNYILTATGNNTINGEGNLTFDGTTLVLVGSQTISQDLTVTGNLTVAGTASFTNTDNLTIRDKFILINSGSTTLADSGWITQYNAAGSGSAFYLEATSTGTYGRFAVAYDAIGASSALTADEYVITAKIGQGSGPAAAPVWGGTTNGTGNMWLTTAGDIYIYA
jgi:hypothetical protein